MAKNKVIKSLTDEQRERILEAPGVIVHRHTGPLKKPFFEPRIKVEERISVRDLLGRDDDIWTEGEDLSE